jgi:hypothetical protein
MKEPWSDLITRTMTLCGQPLQNLVGRLSRVSFAVYELELSKLILRVFNEKHILRVLTDYCKKTGFVPRAGAKHDAYGFVSRLCRVNLTAVMRTRDEQSELERPRKPPSATAGEQLVLFEGVPELKKNRKPPDRTDKRMQELRLLFLDKFTDATGNRKPNNWGEQMTYLMQLHRQFYPNLGADEAATFLNKFYASLKRHEQNDLKVLKANRENRRKT